MNQGDKNKAFLASLDDKTSKQIIDSIANHYGLTSAVMMVDLADEDAECILEYMTDKSLCAATSLLYHAFTMRTWREGDAVQEVTPTMLLALARKWAPSVDATQAQKAAMNAVVTALYHAVNA